jgi:hypothetical protein
MLSIDKADILGEAKSTTISLRNGFPETFVLRCAVARNTPRLNVDCLIASLRPPPEAGV